MPRNGKAREPTANRENGQLSPSFIQEQPQILRLTTPRLKKTPGAPFAQDDSYYSVANFWDRILAAEVSPEAAGVERSNHEEERDGERAASATYRRNAKGERKE